MSLNSNWIKRNLKFALVSLAAVGLSSPALSIPAVRTPGSFVYYLNTQVLWNEADKIKFKWLGDCFSKYSSSGKLKAYVCTNGVVHKRTPSGRKLSCTVARVVSKRKGKAKLTTADCFYR